jgi:baculoviral IAP repeat-containing protein 6
MTIQFNPNLYANGKVYLSLFENDKKEESEDWDPTTSTFLQNMSLSIQSLIFVEEPYFTQKCNNIKYNKLINTSEDIYIIETL